MGTMPSMTMIAYPHAVVLFYRACAVVAIGVILAMIVGRGWLSRALAAQSASASPAAIYRNMAAYWLGGLWLIDGWLQTQPLMVTRFIGGVLVPLVHGQPSWAVAAIRLGTHIWGLNAIGFNVGATYLQVLIGLALLFSRDGSLMRRLALIVSIVWSILVWSGGEAFGSLFHAGSALVGSPGSVFLYALGAVLLLLPEAWWQELRVIRLFPAGFAVFFAFMLFLQVWPPNGWWAAGGTSGYVRSMAGMPQPAWIEHLLGAWAGSLQAHPVVWNAVIAATCLVLGAAWLIRPASRATLYGTIGWALFIWLFGQDLGALGGMGTDLNTGPVLVMYAAMWGLGIGAFGSPGAVAALAPENEVDRPAEPFDSGRSAHPV